MKVKSVGEIEFIERIRRRVPKLHGAIVGIGDDCAVLNYTDDRYLLITADMLIEDIHFDLRKVSAFKVGRKALAVSLSDIASMAGQPKYALASVGIPPEFALSAVDAFYDGLLKLAKEFGVELIGGDTNRSDKFICDVCVIGEVRKEYLITRRGAKVGDGIFVTGLLGGSIKSKHYDFTPRLREAQILARDFKIHSMIDISDGLSLDLHHITDASNVGAVVYDDCIPMSHDARSRQDALAGGEDFELLFTAARDVTEEALRKRLGIPVRKIGKIVARSAGVRLEGSKGTSKEFKREGYTHF